MKITVNIWIFLVIVAIVTLQALAIAKVYNECNRVSDNFNAVMQGVQYNRLKDSTSIARTERLLLDAGEIKQYFPAIEKSINQLDIKLKQLERYVSFNTKSNYHLVVPLRDTTVIIRETLIREQLDTVKMQYAEYRDKWITFKQAIVADTTYTDIQTRDSIAIVHNWQRPHRFLFLRWGRKQYNQTVRNFNPHSTISHTLYIEKQ